MKKYHGKVDPTPPPSLERDAINCLAFLITNQSAWEPEIKLYQSPGTDYVFPLTLIGVQRGE